MLRRIKSSRRSVKFAGIVAVGLAVPAVALASHSSPGVHSVTNGPGADVHRTTYNSNGSVRSYSGPYVGHLKQGDNFRVDRSNSGNVWCIGHAYGNVHQDGNVLCGDLSNN